MGSRFDIADLLAHTPALLAPMAGASDLPFRRCAAAFGARYTVSEMVAGEALANARSDMVRRAAGEGRIFPLVIQLAGREAKWLARGAALAEDAGADVIDINMGCPSKTVTNGLSGSALMRDPDNALRLIEAVVGATRRPVTLKMRLGWCEKSLSAAEIAARAHAAGVQMIVVHARTRQQFFKGQACWGAVRAVVDAARAPVIVNGDIATEADARAALAQSGAAGVMIGRAAVGRPWLVARIEAALAGRPVGAPDAASIAAALGALVLESAETYGPALGVRVARKHIAVAVDDHPGFASLEARAAARRSVCAIETPDQVRLALEQLFCAEEGRIAA